MTLGVPVASWCLNANSLHIISIHIISFNPHKSPMRLVLMKNWIPKRQSNLSESLGSFFPQDCNITFGRYTSNPDDKLYHSKTKLSCCTAETNIMLCQLHLSLKNCIIGLKLLISKYFIWDPVLLFSHLQISFSFRDFNWIFCIYSLNGWPWQNCDAK